MKMGLSVLVTFSSRSLHFRDEFSDTDYGAAYGAASNFLDFVTGQDAEVSGVRNILLGRQAMTVYKPIKTLANATGQLVAAISNGTDTSSIASAKIKNANNKDIPSVLNAVQEVDISNVNSTVIADGFVSKSDVCKDVPPGAGGVC